MRARGLFEAISGNSQHFVRLQAQSPARMIEAICQRKSRIQLAVGTIHGLQEKIPELQIFEHLRLSAGLRIDQLQLVATPLLKPRAGLRADTYPIEVVRSGDGSVSLNGNFETARVQRVDHLLIELQQWLAAGANDKSV